MRGFLSYGGEMRAAHRRGVEKEEELHPSA